MDNLEDKYNAALSHIEDLKLEITRLRSLLGVQDDDNTTSTNKQIIPYTTSPVKRSKVTTVGETNVHQYSTVEDKLALYKSYFRGRDDVYAIRWSNKQGKSGYSPACANEWTFVCEKPRVKCSVCKHQSFMPLTNEVLSDHLDARQDRTIGIYPMLPDETCWFLAMDFDKHDWKQDVSAVMQLCKSHEIPTLLERSRSGNGGHIWIFFSQNIEAAAARRFGMTLLSLTMNERYQIGMESYDRLFPNQDTLPKGGFGNLIALPLQGGPRKQGNSVFVDEHFEPFADQWGILSELGKIGGGKNKRTGIIDIAVIQSLNKTGNVKPFVSEYGQVIVDECHHVSAYSFEQVLREVKAKYVFGLTATPKRQDGQEAIVKFQLGPVLLKVDAKTLSGSRGFSLRVVPRYTHFQIKSGEQTPGIQDIYQQLVDNEERNTLIFDDLLACLDDGRSPLLLVERTAHAEYFAERLQTFAKNVIVLRGRMGKKQREALRAQVASIPDDQERVIIATGKLIGEGFDDARLDTLFLVHPISWSGTLQQYAGRLHRSHVHKEEVKIYDYIDLQVPMLMAMFKKRVKGYRKMGYKGAEL